jgi:FMN phosphatase YigB (HAD superfamily)
MVGDRADNDIAPACAAGLKTWHLHPQGDGDWNALCRALS